MKTTKSHNIPAMVAALAMLSTPVVRATDYTTRRDANNTVITLNSGGTVTVTTNQALNISSGGSFAINPNPADGRIDVTSTSEGSNGVVFVDGASSQADLGTGSSVSGRATGVFVQGGQITANALTVRNCNEINRAKMRRD
jgi:hypothetical protein